MESSITNIACKKIGVLSKAELLDQIRTHQRVIYLIRRNYKVKSKKISEYKSLIDTIIYLFILKTMLAVINPIDSIISWSDSKKEIENF